MQEIVVLTLDEATWLLEFVSTADAHGKNIRIARNGNGVSFKAGGGVWSAPMGSVE